MGWGIYSIQGLVLNSCPLFKKFFFLKTLILKWILKNNLSLVIITVDNPTWPNGIKNNFDFNLFYWSFIGQSFCFDLLSIVADILLYRLILLYLDYADSDYLLIPSKLVPVKNRKNEFVAFGGNVTWIIVTMVCSNKHSIQSKYPTPQHKK